MPTKIEWCHETWNPITGCSPVEKAYNGNGYLVGCSNNWPLPNLWLGVTVEHPDYLWRIDELLKIPAAVRFVSVEPMLEEMNLDPYLNFGFVSKGIFYNNPHPILDWVIAGPETGPGKRECKPEWIRDLYKQCQAAHKKNIQTSQPSYTTYITKICN